MPSVIVLEGASLTDVCCHIDAPGLPDITYNVSRLEHDAFNGRFGAPEEGYFDQLTAPSPDWDEWSGLDRAKVSQFVGSLGNLSVSCRDWRQPSHKCLLRIIDIPIIAVAIFEDVPRILPVDGNHRMMARQLRGYKNFWRFVVPLELEGNYRIRFREL